GIVHPDLFFVYACHLRCLVRRKTRPGRHLLVSQPISSAKTITAISFLLASATPPIHAGVGNRRSPSPSTRRGSTMSTARGARDAGSSPASPKTATCGATCHSEWRLHAALSAP